MLVKQFEDDAPLFQYCGMTGLDSISLTSIPQFFDFLKSIKGDFIIQCFNCARIASWEHIFFAAYNAIWSSKYGKKFSDDLGIQFLLFASGQRQIKVAKERLGLNSNLREMGVVVLGNDQKQFSGIIDQIKSQIGGEENPSLLDLNEAKFEQIMTDFKISEKELHAIMMKSTEENKFTPLIKIVLNRIALLMLEK